MYREIRPSRYKKSRTNIEGESVKQTLSEASIKAYIAALVDLWGVQVSMRTNTHASPRGALVKGLIRTRRQQESKRKREQYEDRGLNSLQDGYTSAEFVRLIRFCWSSGYNVSGQLEPFLRTAADLLLAHTLLLRGEVRRKVQMADLFTLTLDNEGPTPCHAMVVLIDNGKTNQDGRREYGTAVRHKNPLLCTMASIGFYFFMRWNIMGETPPNFQRRELWYDLLVIKGQSNVKPIAYETQLQWSNRVYKGIGLGIKKKTHAGRSQGAKFAELAGVNEGQIRRAGRWNSDSLTTSYLTNIPRKFVRAMAGFQPVETGAYYLPRTKIEPPASLKQALWPWVDEWLLWQASYTGSGSEDVQLPPESVRFDSGKVDHGDLASQGFLYLLDYLRTVILQDSVLFMQEFPGHPIWSHSLFARDDYLCFSQLVRDSLIDVEEPQDVQLRRTVPAIATRLQTIEQSIVQTLKVSEERNVGFLQTIDRNIKDIVDGTVSFTVRANAPGSPLSAAATATATAASTPYATPRCMHGAIPHPSLSPSCSPHPPSSSAVAAAPHTGPPPLSMGFSQSRTIGTVMDLWREWAEGLGGRPSVRSMEEAYGPRWRRHRPGESMMFSRRKVVVDEIVRRQRVQKKSLSVVIEELETVRVKHGFSLNALVKHLKEIRKLA